VFIFPFLTSLSKDSELSQNQLPENKITDLTWDAYRRLMFVDSDLLDFDFMGLVSKVFETTYHDIQTENFTKKLKILLSKNFKYK
jgi:hypothetical protein